MGSISASLNTLNVTLLLCQELLNEASMPESLGHDQPELMFCVDCASGCRGLTVLSVELDGVCGVTVCVW